MDELGLRQHLDACLLTDAEMAEGPQAWTRYDDPFPAWGGRLPEAEGTA
ncbi:hypothetical protein G3N58_06815 [Paraburkholderia sp. Ac-20342]|nr:hypothetical protein [Paraburkholderia sp. Ac-20342]NIF56619.1 hypothetical protein [Burkholderia sp. Ax-1724]NIF77947.1 hypothetical protein [Paraburkholderia sp. Cy-641]